MVLSIYPRSADHTPLKGKGRGKKRLMRMKKDICWARQLISRFSDTELLIVLNDEEKKYSYMYRAFMTTIDKETFLNIQEMQGSI